jgi:hypothetical protein
VRGALALRNARPFPDGALRDVFLLDGRVSPPVTAPAREVDLAGRALLPGLVNALDVLDLSVFPPLGRPPFASLYDWAASLEGAGEPGVRAALAVPLPDRLFLGGMRNLLAATTAVVHHHPYHRVLASDDFPVRVLARYQFADSPGRTPALRRTYRSSDRRIPWLVRVAEGTDERARGELALLAEANVLRQNTVILHGTGLSPEDGPRLAAAHACLVWCPEADRRLYGATAPVRSLRAAGMRIGLGSDSPATGARDTLSALAAARGEAVLDDPDLLDLATRGSGEVVRLPVGGVVEGAPADLIVVEDLARLLEGDRRAVSLVMVAGRPRYGEPALMEAAGARSEDVRVEGARRRLAAPLARRLQALLRAHPQVRAVPWLAGVSFDPGRALGEGPENRVL